MRRLHALIIIVVLATACGSTEAPTDSASSTSTITPSTSTTSTTSTTVAPPACGSSLRTGSQELVISSGGKEYIVEIHVPESWTETETGPAVVAFHSLTYNAAAFRSYSGFDELSEEENFLSVHPNGLDTELDGPALLTIGKNWEIVPDFDEEGRDDVEFFRDLASVLVDDWCVDANRIRIAGDALGAMFSMTLICGASDVIETAYVMGGMYVPPGCTPDVPTPVMHVHGLDNPGFPYAGDGPSDFRQVPGVNEILDKGVFEAFTEMAGLVGCDTTPSESDFGELGIQFDFDGCPDGALHRHVAVDVLKNRWFGEKYDTSGLDGARVAWDFFTEVGS